MKTTTLKNTLFTALAGIVLIAGITTGLNAQNIKPTLLSYHPEVHGANTHSQDLGFILVNYRVFHHTMLTSLENRFERIKADIRDWNLSPVSSERIEAVRQPVMGEVENWMVDPMSWDVTAEQTIEKEYALEDWMNEPFTVETTSALEEEEVRVEDWMVNTTNWITSPASETTITSEQEEIIEDWMVNTSSWITDSAR
jgi:hypothetical protein